MKKIIWIFTLWVGSLSFLLGLFAYATPDNQNIIKVTSDVSWFDLAYEWAYSEWITTQSKEKFNKDWDITRQALSKMLSVFSEEILSKEPDSSVKCTFVDEWDITSDLIPFVKEVCQLWMMWQNVENFKPMWKVTKAQFFTLLSRALWWSKYDGWEPYYQKHVDQLVSKWIIKNQFNFSENITRWEVLTILYDTNSYLEKNPTDEMILEKSAHPYILEFLENSSLSKTEKQLIKKDFIAYWKKYHSYGDKIWDYEYNYHESALSWLNYDYIKASIESVTYEISEYWKILKKMWIDLDDESKYSIWEYYREIIKMDEKLLEFNEYLLQHPQYDEKWYNKLFDSYYEAKHNWLLYNYEFTFYHYKNLDELKLSEAKKDWNTRIWKDWTKYMWDVVNWVIKWKWVLLSSDGDMYSWEFDDNYLSWYWVYSWKKASYEWNFNYSVFHWTWVLTSSGFIYSWDFKYWKPWWNWILDFESSYGWNQYYSWTFVEWERDWYGEYVYSDYFVYKWTWREDKPNWKWNLKFKNWFVYSWNFDDWDYDGYWEATFPDGSIYKWEFLDSDPNWQWTLKLVEGEVYEWVWKDWRLGDIYIDMDRDEIIDLSKPKAM